MADDEKEERSLVESDAVVRDEDGTVRVKMERLGKSGVGTREAETPQE